MTRHPRVEMTEALDPAPEGPEPRADRGWPADAGRRMSGTHAGADLYLVGSIDMDSNLFHDLSYNIILFPPSYFKF